jgi:hypothetical protein
MRVLNNVSSQRLHKLLSVVGTGYVRSIDLVNIHDAVISHD